MYVCGWRQGRYVYKWQIAPADLPCTARFFAALSWLECALLLLASPFAVRRSPFAVRRLLSAPRNTLPRLASDLSGYLRYDSKKRNFAPLRGSRVLLLQCYNAVSPITRPLTKRRNEK